MILDTDHSIALSTLKKRLPELVQLSELSVQFKQRVKATAENWVTIGEKSDKKLPIIRLDVGAHAPNRPTLLLTAGVHGLERIGSEVVLAFLESLLVRSLWDPVMASLLAKLRIVVVPIVNPGGMYLKTRANPNGVDLMRNAPIASESQPPFLIGGQRLSKKLPWYRGHPETSVEIESQTLIDVVEEVTSSSPFVLSLDCHSGFGVTDRIWFPYAYRKRPIAIIDKIYALVQLLNKTYPYHHYKCEPQASSYTAHGDLWDYMYKKSKRSQGAVFIPLTLEMGSWNWIKKRPFQIFSPEGIFNPIVPHRRARVLRRHLKLFEFLCSATAGYHNWLPRSDQSEVLTARAKQCWYSAL